MNTYLVAIKNSLDTVNTYSVKVLDELEKLETLLEKRNYTINLQDMEIELLTEKINKAKEDFDDKKLVQRLY